MRFEVPQFIEVEDKIFGPFTWKQFVYLTGGAGISLVLFLSLPFPLFILTTLPIAGLAGFLAFHQVNNRPFLVFLEAFFRYTTGGKLYLWRREKSQTVGDQERRAATPIQPQTYEPPAPENNIASLARKLELNALEEKKLNNIL